MNNQPLHSGYDRDHLPDDRDRDRADRDRDAPPHHSSAGSIPIHQPVASRVSSSITGPGGLLANHGVSGSSMPIGGPSAPGPGYSGSLHPESSRAPQQTGPPPAGASQHQVFAPMSHGPSGPGGPPSSLSSGPQGPGSMFGGPLQQESGRGMPQDGARGMQQMSYSSGGGVGPGHHMPSGPAGPGGMPHGQQPILNVRV